MTTTRFFWTETLSITPDGAEKYTAKRPCVSKDWGEAEEEEETAGPANKGGAASDGETEIQMPATLQYIFEAFQEGCHETEHFSRVSEQRVLHSQGQLLAASATEKDCLLLGLLSGQI